MTIFDHAYVMDVSDGCAYPRSLYLIDEAHGHPLELVTGCNHRFSCECPDCAKKWRAKNYCKFRDGIQSMREPRMMTLTLKYDKSTGICAHINKIWSFRNILFKRLARGRIVNGKRVDVYKFKSWLAILEFPNHIHLVFDGQFVPELYVRDLWWDITGDSDDVQMDYVYDRTIGHYLSKYLSKISKLPREYLDSLKGLHLFQSHGLKTGFKRPFTFFSDVDGRPVQMGVLGWFRSDEESYNTRVNFLTRPPDYLDSGPPPYIGVDRKLRPPRCGGRTIFTSPSRDDEPVGIMDNWLWAPLLDSVSMSDYYSKWLRGLPPC
jgi:hypothetical protein